MAVTSQYITDDQFQAILKSLNLEYTAQEQEDLLERAVADLETDLVKRFVVPLTGKTGAYSTAPAYAKNKVLNTLKSKIRQLIGSDENRGGIVVESTQRFIDLHQIQYDRDMKALLDAERVFGFKMHSYTEGSAEPTQSIGIARADNEYGVEDDPTI